MEIKKAFIEVFKELFDRGEILKAQYLVNNCVPLDIKNSPDIIDVKEEVNRHVEQICKWSEDGRTYPGTHATVKFNSFPKFVLARDILLNRCIGDNILDIGCYSGVFLNQMDIDGFSCSGIDIHKELMEKLNTESISGPYYKFGSVSKIPFQDDGFDTVTAFDILEHVIDLDKSISEIERVCKPGGLIIVNLPRMTLGYKDESHEHMRMLDDEDINRIWGNKKDFKFEFCNDEFGRPTSFITYTNNK